MQWQSQGLGRAQGPPLRWLPCGVAGIAVRAGTRPAPTLAPCCIAGIAVRAGTRPAPTLAPIMPKATIGYGELWRALKKSRLSALRLVSHDNPSKQRK